MDESGPNFLEYFNGEEFPKVPLKSVIEIVIDRYLTEGNVSVEQIDFTQPDLEQTG